VHGHFITNDLLVFSACGRIIASVELNVPGSLHDSIFTEWGGIYEKTYNHIGTICCADSAFAAVNNDFIIRSTEDITTTAETELEVVQMLEATSLCQASKWGMRATQSAFPRLKDMI
jgi:hypothetical protein